MTIVALVGMPGSGKSTAADIFVEEDFEYVRFGQVVLDEVMARGLEVNEENERMIRESLRKEHGMAVMAKLLIPKFNSLLEHNKKVVADGLYSWEEYKLLKEEYPDDLFILAFYARPETRYGRLAGRKLKSKDKEARYRPITPEQAKARDYSEIENLHKAGPVAMADYTINNEGSVDELKAEVMKVIGMLK